MLRHEDEPKVTDRAVDHRGNGGAIQTHKHTEAVVEHLYVSSVGELSFVTSKYMSKKFQLLMFRTHKNKHTHTG